MEHQIIIEGKPDINALSNEIRKALIDDLLEEILKYYQEGGV